MTSNYRIPPLALMLFFAALMYLSLTIDNPFSVDVRIRAVLLVLLLLAGVFFVILGLGKFRLYKTTVNPNKPETTRVLITSGIYSVSRNPMYVGFVFALLGWALFLCNFGSIILLGIFFLYINYVQIPSEEKALVVIFGSDYKSYQSCVRRWL